MRGSARIAALTLGALALAGCEAQTPTPADVAEGEAEGLPKAEPVEPPTPPSERAD